MIIKRPHGLEKNPQNLLVSAPPGKDLVRLEFDVVLNRTAMLRLDAHGARVAAYLLNLGADIAEGKLVQQYDDHYVVDLPAPHQ